MQFKTFSNVFSIIFTIIFTSIFILFLILLSIEFYHRRQIINNDKINEIYEIKYVDELGYSKSLLTSNYIIVGTCVKFVTIDTKSEYVICNPIEIKKLK